MSLDLCNCYPLFSMCHGKFKVGSVCSLDVLAAQNCGRNVGLDRFKLSEHTYPTSGPAGLKSGLSVCPLHSWNCDFAYMYGCLSLESLA